MRLSFASISVDPLRCVASISGVAVKMGPTEALIFGAIINARGNVVSHRAILNTIYRDLNRQPASDRNAVLAFVSHLRVKLANAGFHNVIVTEYSLGYFFDVNADQTRVARKRTNTPQQHLPETVALVSKMWLEAAAEKVIAAATGISVDQIMRLRMRLCLPKRVDVLAAIAARNRPVRVPGRLDHGPMPLSAGHPWALAILREAGLPV